MADYERTHYESDSGDSDESYEGIPPSDHAFGIQGYQFEPRRDPSNIYASSDSSDSEDIEEEEGDETSSSSDLHSRQRLNRTSSWCRCTKCDSRLLTTYKAYQCCSESTAVLSRASPIGLPEESTYDNGENLF